MKRQRAELFQAPNGNLPDALCGKVANGLSGRAFLLDLRAITTTPLWENTYKVG